MKEGKRSKVWIVVSVILVAWLMLYGLANIFDDKNGVSVGDKIAVVPVLGAISTAGGSSFFIEEEGASSTKIVENLDKAEKDHTVKAIIIEINSPGGTVVASEEIANKIKASNKPVVAWIREIGTSGGYWVASSADVIVADPLSITGSIGVIGSYLEFSKLFEKYGIKYEGLTTGKYKDLGSPYKELTQEERGLLLGKMNILHNAFVDEVAKNRNMAREKVASLATGAFYIGLEAKELGLVDQLGSKQDAINKAKELAGIQEAQIIRYEEEKGLLQILGGVSNDASYALGRGIGFEIAQKMNDNNGLEIAAIG